MTARKTFAEIVRETETEGSRRVAERARLASRVAKAACDGRSRRLAYTVKREAIEHGVAHFARAFALGGIEDDGRLLRVAIRGEMSLHLPVAGCSAETRRWVDSERARVVREWGRGRRAA